MLETLTLKKQHSPRPRMDQEARGNTAFTTPAVRSRRRLFFPPCICAFLLHIFCRICKSALSRGLQQGPDSHPALEAGMGSAELAHASSLRPEHCYLAATPLTITDLLKNPNKLDMKINYSKGSQREGNPSQLTEVGLLLLLLRRRDHFQQFW